MQKKFIHKVPGGKLLKISVDCDSGRITSIRINGDFFAHPEDAIERMEEFLRGKRLVDVELPILDFIETNHVKLYGINASDIAYAIKEAAK